MMLGLILHFLFGLAGGFLAVRKGYPPAVGIVLGAVCGPFGLLIAFVLPRTAQGEADLVVEQQYEADMRASRKNKSCPKCGCAHSVMNRFCPSCMYQYPMEESSAEGAKSFEPG